MPEVTEFVRRAILYKLHLDKKDEAELKEFKDKYGDAVIFTLNHIKRVYFAYEKIPLEKMGICQMCGKKDVQLAWKHESLRKEICGKCFNKLWSIFTLTKADGFQKDLIDAFPDLSVHKGWYAGIIKMSVPAFKSYVKKKQDREKEISRLQIQAQAESNPIKQSKLLKLLRKKEKGIKELEFRKNVIYMGNARMFQFEKKYNRYYLNITDWAKKRNKRTYEVRIGMEDSYTDNTAHNKYKIINQCIDKKEHKVLFGKIIWRDDHFEFMYPKRDITTSLSTKKGILAWFKNNQDAYVISLVYGIKTPIQIVVQEEGRIIDIQSFGNGKSWHDLIRNKGHRIKGMIKIARRHSSKWEKNKSIKRFNKRIGDSERKRIKYATHVLTTELIAYLRKKYGSGIIIMRDSKGIKRINYPPLYRKILHSWNIEMRKTFLEYKEKISNFHILFLKYNESNNLKCAKCGKAIKDEDNKPMKILTWKLNSGMDRKSILQHKFNMLQAKITKLAKYPQTAKMLKYIQQTADELKKTKEMLNAVDTKRNYKLFECPHCGYRINFLVNDALSLSCSLYSDDMPSDAPNASTSMAEGTEAV